MIRFILVLVFLLIFFTLSIPVFLILWIIGKFSPKTRSKISQVIVRGAFRIILFLSGVRYTVNGKENIPDCACLFVGNHTGFYDILISYCTINKVMGFVSKKEIKKVPLLNIWMIYINCLFLDRHSLKEGMKMIMAGIEQLKNGISVFIYPEGTRTKDGTMSPFKEGSLKMGERAKVPIIPVAITNTGDIFDNHKPFIHGARITISFGEPIRTEGMSKDETKHLGAYSQSKVQEMLDAMNT